MSTKTGEINYAEFEADFIKPNTHVLIKLPSENFRVVEMTPGKTISLGKFGSFSVDDVLNKPFGFTYEILENKQLKVINSDYEIDENDKEVSELQAHENNRELVDDSSVQSLAMSDIEELKRQGITGQELIDKMKSSHSAFEKKTQFSQQKYIKRKQQKFLQRFTPVHIGSGELIDIYLHKDPSKISNISEETLALMLSQANIRPGGTYLVVDDIYGVLVAAIMERMGGEGTIVVAHDNEHANLGAFDYLNYSENTKIRMIKSINWLDYFHPEEYETIDHIPQTKLKEMKTSARTQYYRKSKKQQEFKEVRQFIDNCKFDGLITATTMKLSSLIPKLVDAVHGSCPIVAYSEYKENLMDLTNELQKDTRVVAPTIMETRVRRYQTLPGRMHPHMTMRGHGGYILSGLRVVPAEGIEGVGLGAMRKKRKTQS